MKKLFFILLLLPYIAKGTNYTWNNSNGNVLINRTNYPLLTGGDTVFIPFKSNGYRSHSYANLYCGFANPSRAQLIHIIWESFITPSSANLFANSIDSIYGVEIAFVTMNDHIDPAFSSYANTGYSSFVFINQYTGRGANGFFPGSPQSFTLPAFNNDSSRAFKNWTFTLHMDSLDGGNSGSTCVLFGAIATNQVWLNPSFINCYFGHYSSAGGPAGYINAANSYNLQSIPFMDNDTIEALGVVANPNGHAAAVFLRDWLGNITHCRWGKDNFCTCVRIFQNADLAYWSSAYAGVNKIYDNLFYNSRKYCFVESRSTFSDTSVIHSRRRPGPHVDKNTLYNMGIGVGLSPPSAYKAGLYEIYDVDSIFFHGNDLMMCRDSVFTSADGPFLWTYSGTGPPAYFDSAGNNIGQTWAKGYLVDSVLFRPILNSFIYNGVPLSALPAWINDDFYKNAVPTIGRAPFGSISGIDGGSVQLSLSQSCNCIVVPAGSRILIH